MLAISTDSPEDSRAFAASYNIWFPLLSDANGNVSRQFTGITSDDNTLPGVVIINPEGHVVFRQLATSKEDRLSTAELVAQLDKSLGTHGPDLVDKHYAAIDRAQIRLDAGAGSVDSKTTGIATVSALVPLNRYVIIGPRVNVDLRGAPLQIGGELAFRLPLVRDTTTLELGAVASYSEWKPAGAILGGIANLWFAYSPKWSLQLGVEIDSPSRVTGTFGIGRLLEF